MTRPSWRWPARKRRENGRRTSAISASTTTASITSAPTAISCRLAAEGRISAAAWERQFYDLALKLSGAVQRGLDADGRGGGYIYSFNGPHSLFVDTIRSLRSLALPTAGPRALGGERPQVSLLGRLKAHAAATARYSMYYGEGRDAYDLRGRVAHESIFNINDGAYRAPNSQQGYSPFSTWTRGLAWAYAARRTAGVLGRDRRSRACAVLVKAARATCDFYIDAATAADGIPYWDTGAPGLREIGRLAIAARPTRQSARAGR